MIKKAVIQKLSLLFEIHDAFSIEHKVYKLTDIRDRYRYILSQLDIDSKSYKSHKIKGRLIEHYDKKFFLINQRM